MQSITITNLLFEEVVQEAAPNPNEVTPQQAQGIEHVLQSLGIDPSGVVGNSEADNVEEGLVGEVLFTEEEEQLPLNVSQETEVKPPTAPIKPKTRKSVNIPLKIAPGTIEAAKRFFELGRKAGDWYYDAHNTLKEAFGGDEHGMVLFCMLLAATSVQNEVYTNFIEAVTIYQAIQKDAQSQPQKLRKFAQDVSAGNMTINAASAYYSSLNIFKDAGAIKVMSFAGKFANIARTLKLWLDKGKLTKDVARTALINSLVPRKIDKKTLASLPPEEMFKPGNPFIGKMKIANYALTLLDPSFASSEENPFNVVVDTWMWRVFFPDFLQQGMDQTQSAKLLSKLFASKNHYGTVANLVSQLAGEAGVSPHVMQAAIWTGIKMQWEGKAAEGETNYVSSINTLISRYGAAIDGLKAESNKLAAILKSLSTPVAAQAVQDRRRDNILTVVNRNIAKRAAAKLPKPVEAPKQQSFGF